MYDLLTLTKQILGAGCTQLPEVVVGVASYSLGVCSVECTPQANTHKCDVGEQHYWEIIGI